LACARSEKLASKVPSHEPMRECFVLLRRSDRRQSQSISLITKANNIEETIVGQRIYLQSEFTPKTRDASNTQLLGHACGNVDHKDTAIPLGWRTKELRF
jgi:hypothetical protein